jgi:hypothetical protein
MRTHRFGRKIKLPATITIKHQIRMMALDELKKAEAQLIEQSARPTVRHDTLPLSTLGSLTDTAGGLSMSDVSRHQPAALSCL